MSDNIAADQWHEVVDRVHVIERTFRSLVVRHEAVLSDGVVLRAADALSDAIADFYQLVGSRMAAAEDKA